MLGTKSHHEVMELPGPSREGLPNTHRHVGQLRNCPTLGPDQESDVRKKQNS